MGFNITDEIIPGYALGGIHIRTPLIYGVAGI